MRPALGALAGAAVAGVFLLGAGLRLLSLEEDLEDGDLEEAG